MKTEVSVKEIMSMPQEGRENGQITWKKGGRRGGEGKIHSPTIKEYLGY